jgi:hypothetical protein
VPTDGGPAEDAGATGRTDSGRSEPDNEGDAAALDRDAAAGDAGADSGAEPQTPDRPAEGVTVEPPFDEHYRAYDLGPLPGIEGDRLRVGGCVVDPADRNTLLVTASSRSDGRWRSALYAVGVERGPAGHILRFSGSVEVRSELPGRQVDANVFRDGEGHLLATLFDDGNPIGVLSGSGSSVRQLLVPGDVGVPGRWAGAAFVPRGHPAAGALRMAAWPSDTWWHIDYTYDESGYTLRSAEQRAELPNGSGGFAYVPSGSPEIERDSVVLAEWSERVSFFEVDREGDPLVETRRVFLRGLSSAWGAYFEPVTGDFLFPEWNRDAFVIVQGFVPPPEPPELF